jgi:hypothetical protein
MPGNLKSDVKLGYGIGIGLFLLGLTLMLVQLILGRVRGK